MIWSVLFTLGFGLGSLLLAWQYFRHYALKRPPIGVINLWDIAAIMAGILAVPYAYLWLPLWMVGGLLGLAALGICYFTLDPVIANRWLLWVSVLVLIVGDFFLWYGFSPKSQVAMAANNVVQLIVVVGGANLWAQGGMKARDCAILCGALIVYDTVFTSVLPLMDSLFARLAGLPFAPLLGWPLEDGRWLVIGLGDLLLASVFPLVMRKAYGRTAGRVALFLAIGALVAIFLLPTLGLLGSTFPVMIVLGPLMVAQYLVWRWRLGIERTTRQYLAAEARV